MSRRNLSLLAAVVVALLSAVALSIMWDQTAAAFDGVVTESRVRLRAEIWGEQVGWLRVGQTVDVQSSAQDRNGATWFKVETEDGSGWVYGSYVRPVLSSRAGRGSSDYHSDPTSSSQPMLGWQWTAAPVSPTQTSQSSGRVGLQVGHWRNWEAPAPLNRQSGSSWNRITEAEVNLKIAELTATYLRDLGYQVDLLPTVIPNGYRADVVVFIHADGGPATRRGFFADRRASGSAAAAEDARLVSILNREYAAITGIPHVHRGTPGTRAYYGYYRVAPGVPMAIIETGFLTNAADREVILKQPGLAAHAIASAIDLFLKGR